MDTRDTKKQRTEEYQASLLAKIVQLEKDNNALTKDKNALK